MPNGRRRPAKRPANPRDELCAIDRLDEVVVCTQEQPGCPIERRPAVGRRHDHGKVVPVPVQQLREQREPVEIGELDLDDRDRRRLDQEQLERRLCVSGCPDGELERRENVLRSYAEAAISIDHEDDAAVTRQALPPFVPQIPRTSHRVVTQMGHFCKLHPRVDRLARSRRSPSGGAAWGIPTVTRSKAAGCGCLLARGTRRARTSPARLTVGEDGNGKGTELGEYSACYVVALVGFFLARCAIFVASGTAVIQSCATSATLSGQRLRDRRDRASGGWVEEERRPDRRART